MVTKADQLLEEVLDKLKLGDKEPREKYSKIESIVSELNIINDTNTINVKTTGTISERMCEWALKSTIPESYYHLSERFGANWSWLGDFGVFGYPLNFIISVKSFKAKERLLVSGSGSALAPTLGWGLFKDKSEFNKARLNSYRIRGFMAIYMPSTTIQNLSSDEINFTNMNGTKLLRPLGNFPNDIDACSVDVGPIKVMSLKNF